MCPLLISHFRTGPTFKLLRRGFELCFFLWARTVFFSHNINQFYFLAGTWKIGNNFIKFYKISYQKVLSQVFIYIFFLIFQDKIIYFLKIWRQKIKKQTLQPPFPLLPHSHNYNLNERSLKYKCLYCMYV